MHRWSDPTYLAGLALLGEHWPGDLPAVEVACGHGPYLRELGQRGVVDRTGVDVVLAKAWLGRRFVDPGAAWLCAGRHRGAGAAAGPGPVGAVPRRPVLRGRQGRGGWRP